MQPLFVHSGHLIDAIVSLRHVSHDLFSNICPESPRPDHEVSKAALCTLVPELTAITCDSLLLNSKYIYTSHDLNMSTPVELFSDLSLHSPMSSPLTGFDLRKIEVRDIITSFSPTTLPTEFKPRLYRTILAEQGDRPSNEWTIAADLEGTLMQWGVHNDECYDFLTQCQPADKRAILFFQKATRRFNLEFAAYEELPFMEAGGQTIDASPSRERAEVRSIAIRLRAIVTAFAFDQQERQIKGDNSNRLRPLVEALQKVCSEPERGPESRRARRGSGNQSGESLFQELIARPGQDQSHFMLGLLNSFEVDALREFRAELEEIGERLRDQNAPLVYRSKYQEILDRITPSPIGAPPSPPQGPPPDNGQGPSGGKRRAAPEPSARRGRRKTGK